MPSPSTEEILCDVQRTQWLLRGTQCAWHARGVHCAVSEPRVHRMTNWYHGFTFSRTFSSDFRRAMRRAFERAREERPPLARLAGLRGGGRVSGRRGLRSVRVTFCVRLCKTFNLLSGVRKNVTLDTWRLTKVTVNSYLFTVHAAVDYTGKNKAPRVPGPRRLLGCPDPRQSTRASHLGAQDRSRDLTGAINGDVPNPIFCLNRIGRIRG